MSGSCGTQFGPSDLGMIADFLDVGDDLTLRAPTIYDSAALFLQVNHNRENLREWLPWLDKTQTLEDEIGFLQMSIEDRGNGLTALWLIYLDEELVGTVGLNWIDSQNRGCGIGYWLAKDFTGRGIVTRCCQRIMRHIFEDVGMRRLVLEAAVENSASRAVAERLGMRLEGITKDREWLYDHYVDAALYAITAPEWFSRQGHDTDTTVE